MIDINYSNEGIKITTKDLSFSFAKYQLPLKFEIKKVVSKEVVWSVDLGSNMWAVYPQTEIFDVIVKDALGNFIYQYYWDIIQHGSIFYKSLWLYCKSLINRGIKPKGLVIGTHDGEFGEWVPLVRNHMSDVLLVEGSNRQYQKLVQNYQGKDGVQLMNEIITPDGKDVIFFQGGEGYTNSVVERVIRHWEKEQINPISQTSVSIIDLVDGNFFNQLNWLHLDVEGLDAKLILALDKRLPDFIIFEDYNLLPDEKNTLFQYLESINYKLFSDSGICMGRRGF